MATEHVSQMEASIHALAAGRVSTLVLRRNLDIIFRSEKWSVLNSDENKRRNGRITRRCEMLCGLKPTANWA